MTNRDIAAIKTASTISLLAGIWLFISPWVYGAYATPNVWNSWIVGYCIMLFGAVRMGSPEVRGASVVSLLLGIWTFASPWIFRYPGNASRFVSSMCVGALVFILGAYASSMGRTTTAPPPLRT